MLLEYDYSHCTLPELRSFQTKVMNTIKDEDITQMITAPTGSGKSIVIMALALKELTAGNKVLIIVDRLIILEQLEKDAIRFKMPYGIIQGNHRLTNSECPLQICSSLTLKRREIPEHAVLIIDEAHCLSKYLKEYIVSSGVKTYGLTATPFAVGLGKIFQKLIAPVTMNELIEQKLLVPLKIYSCTTINMKGAKIIAGEFSDRAVEERGRAVIGNVVEEWRKYAQNRKTIVFGATIAHCSEMVVEFLKHGIKAELFCYKTDKEMRKDILEEFNDTQSELKILVSVESLSKGFDSPIVGCICDCRPLRKSLSALMQMYGRGMRISPNKLDCILLDFSHNIHRFGADFTQIYYDGITMLHMGEKLDAVARKESKVKAERCQKCGYSPVYKRCLGCGYTIPNMPSNIGILKGTMSEVVLKYAKNNSNLWGYCVFHSLLSHSPKKEAMARAIYKKITGQWSAYKFDARLALQPTPEFKERLQDDYQEWIMQKLQKEAEIMSLPF